MDVKKEIPYVGKIQRWSVTGITLSDIKTCQSIFPKFEVVINKSPNGLFFGLINNIVSVSVNIYI
jgi:hypothetical protein